MPKYYFDSFDGSQILADVFGDEFCSDKDAARQAVELLPEFMKDHLSEQDNVHAGISVRNDRGEVIYRSMAVIRSQWPSRENHSFRIKIDQKECVISQSRRLRAELQDLTDRMRVNAEQLFSSLERAAANMEISRRLMGGTL